MSTAFLHLPLPVVSTSHRYSHRYCGGALLFGAVDAGGFVVCGVFGCESSFGVVLGSVCGVVGSGFGAEEFGVGDAVPGVGAAVCGCGAAVCGCGAAVWGCGLAEFPGGGVVCAPGFDRVPGVDWLGAVALDWPISVISFMATSTPTGWRSVEVGPGAP